MVWELVLLVVRKIDGFLDIVDYLYKIVLGIGLCCLYFSSWICGWFSRRVNLGLGFFSMPPQISSVFLLWNV
jgi:hypothetical protein